MKFDKDIDLIISASRAKSMLKEYNIICPIIKDILELSRTRDGIERLFSINDQEYQVKAYHILYHENNHLLSEREVIELVNRILKR